jgi:hypothetical protein
MRKYGGVPASCQTANLHFSSTTRRYLPSWLSLTLYSIIDDKFSESGSQLQGDLDHVGRPKRGRFLS